MDIPNRVQSIHLQNRIHSDIIYCLYSSVSPGPCKTMSSCIARTANTTRLSIRPERGETETHKSRQRTRELTAPVSIVGKLGARRRGKIYINADQPTTRLNHSCHVLQTYVHFSSFFILLTVVAAIREYDAKLLLSYWLTRVPTIDSSIQLGASATPALPRVAQVLFDEETKQTTGLAELPAWTRESGVKLVAKPDQLIKRRGKAGLLALNKTIDEAMAWIGDRAGKVQKVRQPSYR